MKGVDKWDDFR